MSLIDIYLHMKNEKHPEDPFITPDEKTRMARYEVFYNAVLQTIIEPSIKKLIPKLTSNGYKIWQPSTEEALAAVNGTSRVIIEKKIPVQILFVPALRMGGIRVERFIMKDPEYKKPLDAVFIYFKDFTHVKFEQIIIEALQLVND